MKVYFLDTNIFLRFVVDGSEKVKDKIQALFDRAIEGKVKLFTSVVVVFETCWVLKHYYKKDKKEVIQIIEDFLRSDFIDIENRKFFLEAVDYARNTSVELQDCYNAFYALSKKKDCRLLTFDKKFKKHFPKIKNYKN